MAHDSMKCERSNETCSSKSHHPHQCAPLPPSCHVMSCRVVSCRVVLCCALSCHVMSYHVMSCHVISCHVMSCRIISCHVLLCHDLSPFHSALSSLFCRHLPGNCSSPPFIQDPPFDPNLTVLEAALAGDSPAMVAAREYEQAVADSEGAMGGEGEAEGRL